MVVRVGEIHALRHVAAAWRIFALADVEVLRFGVGGIHAQTTHSIDVAHQHVQDQTSAPTLHAMLFGRQAAEGVKHGGAIAQLLPFHFNELANARFLGKGLRQARDRCNGHIGDGLGGNRRHVSNTVDKDLESRTHRLAIDGVRTF